MSYVILFLAIIIFEYLKFVKTYRNTNKMKNLKQTFECFRAGFLRILSFSILFYTVRFISSNVTMKTMPKYLILLQSLFFLNITFLYHLIVLQTNVHSVYILFIISPRELSVLAVESSAASFSDDCI